MADDDLRAFIQKIGYIEAMPVVTDPGVLNPYEFIGTVINKKKIAASRIYQMMLDADVENVKCLTFADADVAEFIVKEGSRITKDKVKDLGLPKGTTIGGLVRKGEGMVVNGNTQIEKGDHVMVFCLSSMIQKIEKFFK